MEFLILLISLILGFGMVLGIPFLVYDKWSQIKQLIFEDEITIMFFILIAFLLADVGRRRI